MLNAALRQLPGAALIDTFENEHSTALIAHDGANTCAEGRGHRRNLAGDLPKGSAAVTTDGATPPSGCHI
jgi:hypothetical protein